MENILLHRDSLKFLEIIEHRSKMLLGDKQLSDLPIDEARKCFRQLLLPESTKLPPIELEVTNKSFAYDSVNIPFRIYRSFTEKKLLPALVFFHGGGFVFGDLELIDYSCRFLAKNSQWMVVSVDYRRAPEYKFPTSHYDCYQAVKYVQTHAEELGSNGVIAVGGESAGGNLAASICHMAKKLKDVEISLQILYYPWLDLKSNYPSAKKFATGYLLELSSLYWMRDLFLKDSTQETDPIASPLLQEDFKNLPPALILAAECDPIYDEGRLYFDNLIKADVNAQYVEFGGILHGFFAMPWFFESAFLSINLVAGALRLVQ